MTNTVLKTLNNNNRIILNSGLKYREVIQDNIEVFLKYYDNDLNYNSSPLQKMFENIKAVKQSDLFVVKQYMKKISNIKAFNTNDKGNLTIALDGDKVIIDKEKALKTWYEVEVKTIITDEGFKDTSKMITAFNNFYNKLLKSVDKLNLTEKTLKDFENLKTQLTSYKA